MAATIFAIAVSIIIVGWLWFYVARPILEDWGVIRVETESERVNHYQDDGIDIMSRDPINALANAPSSLQTDGRQTADRPMLPAPTRDIMLDTYKVLRKHGMAREEARAMLKALNLPLDNNLWTQAAPSADEPTVLTPIAQRPTKASFYDEPELEYQPPPNRTS